MSRNSNVIDDKRSSALLCPRLQMCNEGIKKNTEISSIFSKGLGASCPVVKNLTLNSYVFHLRQSLI